jgi:hypothetical protein
MYPDNGGEYVYDDLKKSTMYDFYLVQLGPYMVEGEGPAMLQEVFVSPSDTGVRDSWDAWRALIRQEDGAVQHPAANAMQNIYCGSYRYPQQNMLTPSLFAIDIRGGARSAEFRTQSTATRVGTQYITYNRVSDIAFPDRKVVFFSVFSIHDPGPLRVWCEEGVTSTIAVADGSARALKSSIDAIQVNGENRNDLAGPVYVYTQSGVGLHFIMTNGGIRGRDL